MTNLDHALFYGTVRKWPVVPIIPGEKRPAIDRWVERATTDPELIEQWWTAHPEHGIGIVTGERAGIFVLDVDPDKGGDDTLADLEAEHGRLPDTVETITGSGGRHIFFKWPGWNPGTNAGILGPGLDIRAEGGQIVAPPTIHPNGRIYAFDVEHDPHDGIAVADAPGWLLDLIQKLELPQYPDQNTIPYVGAPRPGDRFAASVTWPDLLEADGAQLVDKRIDRHTNSYYELWTRPGKNGKDGASASLYYGGTDLLKVFTTNWPGLTAGETYTRFGYLVFTRYGGNFETATRELGKIQQDEQISRWLKGITPRVAAEPITDDVEEDDDPLPKPIVWPEFWNRETHSNEWLCEPFLPQGRQVAFYAPAKLGKSLLAFEVAAAIATGRPVLARTAQDPLPVMYVDLEMTLDDVEERLEAMGYSDTDDLTSLYYYSLPTFGPLDTAEGAAGVIARATQHDARLVVVDTMARAVHGEENSADTYRSFYRHLGMALKAAGITLLRIDHAGKDLAKGQRGSSEKVGDVDVVWRLSAIDAEAGTFEVESTHRRVTWVPDKFQVTRHNDPELRHELLAADAKTIPAGTGECVELLNRLAVPLDASYKTANTAIKRHDPKGKGRRKAVILAAQEARNSAGTASGTALGNLNAVPISEKHSDQVRNGSGTGGNRKSGKGCVSVSLDTEPPNPRPGPIRPEDLI